MRRVVITGMGIYSCIGKNLSEVTDSLYNGKSGIGIDPQRKEMGYLSALTGLLCLRSPRCLDGNTHNFYPARSAYTF